MDKDKIISIVKNAIANNVQKLEDYLYALYSDDVDQIAEQVASDILGD